MPDLYELRIFGFCPAGTGPLTYTAHSMAECLDMAENRMYARVKPGVVYTCEIWTCVGVAPVRLVYSRNLVVLS